MGGPRESRSKRDDDRRVPVVRVEQDRYHLATEQRDGGLLGPIGLDFDQNRLGTFGFATRRNNAGDIACRPLDEADDAERAWQLKIARRAFASE